LGLETRNLCYVTEAIATVPATNAQTSRIMTALDYSGDLSGEVLEVSSGITLRKKLGY
jgi:hypothetical protein